MLNLCLLLRAPLHLRLGQGLQLTTHLGRFDDGTAHGVVAGGKLLGGVVVYAINVLR